jgi:hypothetical protein
VERTSRSVISWTVVVLFYGVLVLAASVMVHCQVRPYAESGIRVANSMGYLPPIVVGKAGVEANGKRYLLDASVEYNLARKVETGDGTQLNAGVDAMLRHRALLVGAGVQRVEQRTSPWSKTSVRPSVLLGADTEYVRVLVRYTAAGTDTRNNVQSVGVGLDWKASNKFRICQGFAFPWLHGTDWPADKRKAFVPTITVKWFPFGGARSGS